MKRVLFGCLLFLVGCANRHDFSAHRADNFASLPAQIYFGFDSDRVRPDEKTALERSTQLLKQHPNLRLLVAGHADPVGSAEYNLELGDRRARSVLVELVQRGVDPTRLTVVSFGESRPLAGGSTKNRRVELVVR